MTTKDLLYKTSGDSKRNAITHKSISGYPLHLSQDDIYKRIQKNVVNADELLNYSEFRNRKK